MKVLKDKVAVITGAGSGIGRALALGLAREGSHIMATDIKSDTLEETKSLVEKAGGKCETFLMDVSKREEVEALYEKTLELFGQADLIVNNAGVALGDLLINELSFEQFEWIVGINFWGVVYGTKVFLPHFLKRPEAHIINISSIFGIIGVATNGPYCSTKFAVRGFSESLIQEVWNTNVKVTSVHPGGIDTNIVKNAQIKDEGRRDEMVKRFAKAARVSPDQAAETIIKGIKKNKRRVLIGNDAWIMDKLARLFPSTYHNRIIKWVNRVLD